MTMTMTMMVTLRCYAIPAVTMTIAKWNGKTTRGGATEDDTDTDGDDGINTPLGVTAAIWNALKKVVSSKTMEGDDVKQQRGKTDQDKQTWKGMVDRRDSSQPIKQQQKQAESQTKDKEEDHGSSNYLREN